MDVQPSKATTTGSTAQRMIRPHISIWRHILGEHSCRLAHTHTQKDYFSSKFKIHKLFKRNVKRSFWPTDPLQAKAGFKLTDHDERATTFHLVLINTPDSKAWEKVDQLVLKCFHLLIRPNEIGDDLTLFWTKYERLVRYTFLTLTVRGWPVGCVESRVFR